MRVILLLACLLALGEGPIHADDLSPGPKPSPSPRAKRPRRKKVRRKTSRTQPAPEAVSSPSAGPEESWLTYRASLQWINAISGSQILTSPANPGNFQGIPNLEAISELRPDLKIDADKVLFLARPQFRYTPSQTNTNGITYHSLGLEQADFYFNDLFMQWAPGDTVILAYGLQNYQWGPAESFSPTNTIFHETIQSKDVLFEFRGHHIVRANFTPAEDWSFVLLGEITGDGEPSFIANQAFERQFILKSEHNWNSGADYAGLALNWREFTGNSFGEYFNLSFANGFSIYADVDHAVGSHSWYPVTQTNPDGSTGVTLAQSQASNSSLYTLAVTGMRYSFVNGSDARLEYIFNQAGYNSSQEALIRQALVSPGPFQLLTNLQNTSQFISPGLEFPGQQFLFASLRIPDFLELKGLSFYSRYMFSLTDQSGTAYSTLEYLVGSSGTLFSAVGFSHGDPLSELRGLVSYTAIGGYKHAW